MENNYTIQINLYGEYMTINLPENYDSFKTQISSIFYLIFFIKIMIIFK